MPPDSTLTRPMRVVHLITDLDVGGAEIILARVVESFSAREVDTTVVSLTSGGVVAERLIEKGVRVIGLGMSRHRLNLGRLIHLWRLLRRLKPDLVQTWLYHADLAGLLAGTLAGVPVIVWNLRCSELNFRESDPLLSLLLRLLAWTSGRPEAVVSNSEAGRRAHERLGYRPKRWAIIPNGFDTTALSPSPRARAEVRDELRISQSAPLVGLIARLHPMKDHATFMAAAAIVASREPDVRFLLAGRGVDGSQTLKGLAQQVGSGGRVHLLGESADAPRWLAALDVLVSSSSSEGFPNVVAEAMACGTPCVVTDVGDSALIVGDTGVVVPPNDPPALADGILRLLAMSSKEREALGLRARDRIAREYSLARAVARYRGLYEELVGSVRGGQAQVCVE